MRDNRLFYNHISSLKLQSYEFVIHYAEELDSKVAEFPHQHPLYEIYYSLEGVTHIYLKESQDLKVWKSEKILIAKRTKSVDNLGQNPYN